jgi:putative Mg2+ transporter-C (MgtC) family protein
MILTQKFIIDITLCIILAGLLGYERQVHRGIRSVGIRTYILMCLGSMLLILISIDKFPNDSARIIAGMISAAGFIAAGTAIFNRQEVLGLTTGIGLFVVSIIGMLIAMEYYLISVISTLFLWIVLESWRLEVIMGYKKK